MPTFCAVVGCGRRGDRDKGKHSFFRIPSIPKNGNSNLIHLKTKRRMKWILALRRADLTETKLKYGVVCDRHFISGRPATQYEIDNPDWVPSLNMGYTVNPQKQRRGGFTSPHVEYIRKTTANEKESSTNESDNANQSSLLNVIRSDNIQESNEESNMSESTENSSVAYQNVLSNEDTADEENASGEGTNLPDAFIAYNKLITPHKVFEDDVATSSEEISADESDASEFESTSNEFMSSKKVQTDLTMIDLDKISEAFKSSVLEVKQLKAKMKSLTEDILHLNEVYC